MNPAQIAFTPVFNHLLGQHGWARERLARHAGQSFTVISGPVTLQCTVLADGLVGPLARPFEADDDTTDALPDSAVTLLLAPEHWPKILINGMDDLNGAIQIQGDAEFAESLGTVFRHLRWDAGEDLSRFTGDVVAQRIVVTAQQAHATLNRSAQSALANVTEFLADESGMLVRPVETRTLQQQLSILRDDLARLDKRVRKLEQR